MCRKPSLPALFAVLIALLVALPALPAPAKGLEGLKIGVVNLNEALNRSVAGERSKNILIASKTQLENELKSKEDDLKKKREELQSNMMLTKEARDGRENELRNQERKLRQDVQDAQRELQDKERKLTESIIIELRTVIETLAKEQQYDLVVEKNAADVILFSKSKFDDLTEQVIERYNKFNADSKAPKKK